MVWSIIEDSFKELEWKGKTNPSICVFKNKYDKGIHKFMDRKDKPTGKWTQRI